MPRARLDHKARKPQGFVAPAGISGKDAWEKAETKKDDWDTPLPSTPSESAPARAKIVLDWCRCHCGCGSKGAGGECYMCSRDVHHRCSRACREYQPTTPGAQYIPPRSACGGGKGRG